MVDLKNPKWEEFEVIKAPERKKTGKMPFVSFYRVKRGVIPRKEHKITDLPEGIL
ncbi:MAG: hypothetical protein KBT22_03295 [Bacteroidales bacterium]|nr:hypothetical protein [Candidatus Scybalocola fimicaballi]